MARIEALVKPGFASTAAGLLVRLLLELRTGCGTAAPA
jgi:hypothetical protein